MCHLHLWNSDNSVCPLLFFNYAQVKDATPEWRVWIANVQNYDELSASSWLVHVLSLCCTLLILYLPTCFDSRHFDATAVKFMPQCHCHFITSGASRLPLMEVELGPLLSICIMHRWKMIQRAAEWREECAHFSNFNEEQSQLSRWVGDAAMGWPCSV